jgi:hypothetical protein
MLSLEALRSDPMGRVARKLAKLGLLDRLRMLALPLSESLSEGIE